MAIIALIALCLEDHISMMSIILIEVKRSKLNCMLKLQKVEMFVTGTDEVGAMIMEVINNMVFSLKNK